VDLYSIKLENGVLTLDGKKIQGLLGYEIRKSSAFDLPELFLKLVVEDRKKDSSS